MRENLSYCVILPAYNESRHLETVVGRIPDWVDGVVVDDASTDDTLRVAQELADARVRVLRHQGNQGVGGAMVTGFRSALDGGCDVVIKMDADDQMDATELPTLVRPIELGMAEYVKGNRFRRTGRPSSMPGSRWFGNVVLSFLTKVASGYWHVFDPQCGFIAITAPTLRRLKLDGIARDYFFENDMLIRLNVIDARVVDVDTSALYSEETSTLRIGRVSAVGHIWSARYGRHGDDRGCAAHRWPSDAPAGSLCRGSVISRMPRRRASFPVTRCAPNASVRDCQALPQSRFVSVPIHRHGLVVTKHPASPRRKRERADALQIERQRTCQLCQLRWAKILNMGRIGSETGSLRDDDDYSSASLHEWQMVGEQLSGFLHAHMLQNVGAQERVEGALSVPLRAHELLVGVRLEPSRARRRHGVRIVIDPDAMTIEMRQVAADAAAHVEHKAGLEPADVPAVWTLHIEQPFPARRLRPPQSICIRPIARAHLGPQTVDRPGHCKGCHGTASRGQRRGDLRPLRTTLPCCPACGR